MNSLTKSKTVLSKRARALILGAALSLQAVTLPDSFSAATSSASTATSKSHISRKITRFEAESTCSPAQDQICETGPLVTPEDAELLMWKLINRDRSDTTCEEETQGRAHTLQWDSRLATVARKHSEEMASNNFFGHAGTDGSAPDVRITRAGVQWRATGENIAKFSSVSDAEAAFMDEPKFQSNHRANILNPDYTHVGVGIAIGQDGMLYITQEFAQLR